MHFIGRIFTERQHELAAGSMNVWWSGPDRSEVAEPPPVPILPVITSLVDQIKGPCWWGGVCGSVGTRMNKWLTERRTEPWFVRRQPFRHRKLSGFFFLGFFHHVELRGYLCSKVNFSGLFGNFFLWEYCYVLAFCNIWLLIFELLCILFSS